jgi:SNF2 family DNA or RNA helicase
VVNIFLSDDKESVEIQFSGETFQDIYVLLKSHYFTYNIENKTWTSSPKKIYSILDQIGDIDDCLIQPQALTFLENNLIKKETKFIREKFNSDLLEFPPLKGKHPFETYQLDDTKQGISQNRLMLAHEMGLGKTKILIDILNHLWNKKKIDKILILSPIEGIYNWRRELLKFSKFWTIDDINIASVSNRRPFETKAKIIICTYRTFLMLSDDYYGYAYPKNKGQVKKYQKPPIPLDTWGTNRCIILDESHKSKNPKARITYVLNLHKRFFEYRYLATGTPAPNEIKDYYSQLKFMDEGIIQDDYYDWLEKIANLGNRFSKKAINYYYPEKVEEFINKTKPWIIRRKSDDCLELPNLRISKVYTPLNQKQTEIYQKLSLYILKKIGVNKKYNLRNVVNSFSYFSLAIDNPDILQNSESIINNNDAYMILMKTLKGWKFTNHSKLLVCDSLVHKYIEEENNKLIIWTGHPLTADSLAEYYSKYDPVVLHGQIDIPLELTRSDYRDKLLNDFKQDKDKKLMIASYKVIGLAVNLTEITRNIYFDRSYSLTDWLQSIKRTHRYGQEEKVMVDVIVCENTLDEHLDRLLTKKENINKFLLDRVHLSIDEIKLLLMGKEIE